MMTMLRVVALCLVVYVASVVSYDQDACCLGGIEKDQMRDDIWKLQHVYSPPPGQMQNSRSCCHLVHATWTMATDLWNCYYYPNNDPNNPPIPVDEVEEVVCCGACRLRDFDPNNPTPWNPWNPNGWPARFGDMMCCRETAGQEFQVHCDLFGSNPVVSRVYHFLQHTACEVTV